MELVICNKPFDSNKINSLSIREREVFIDYEDEFFRLKYKEETEIKDAQLYVKLQQLTYQDLYEAMHIIISICDVFINSKTQCDTCPLHKSGKCSINSIPINWM